MPLETLFTDQRWSRAGIWMHSPGSVEVIPGWLPNVVLGWFYNHIFPIGYHPVGDIFGKVDPFQSTRKEVRSWKPHTRPYDDHRDYDKYGSLLSLGQILAGSASFNPTGENDTNHKAYRGRLINSPTPGPTTYDPLHTYSYDAWPFHFTAPVEAPGFLRATDWANQAYLDTSVVPHQWTTCWGDESGVQRRIYGVLDEARLANFANTANTDVFYTSVYNESARWSGFDVSYTYTPLEGFLFEYTGHQTYWVAGYPNDDVTCRRAVCRHTIRGEVIRGTSAMVQPNPGWNYASYNGYALRLSCQSEIKELYSYWEGYPSSYWDPWRVGDIRNSASAIFSGPDVGLLTFPVSANPFPDGNADTFIRNHTPWRKKFYSLVDDYANDIRASSSISTAKALASANIGDNIQDILKLKDISPSAIVALSKMVSVVLKQQNPSIKEAIDVLSGLRLSTSFEYRPELEFITRDLPVLLSTRLDRNFHLGRGKFIYDFPLSAFGRAVTLTTNTRIVLLSPRNNFLGAVLGLRESGLDPSPSRVWHLFPFTFVVDWVAGLGSRIERAEDILLNASSPIVNLVHSYTVSTVVEQQEIDISLPGASVDPFESTDNLEMRGYFREVSRFLPPFRDSRFDFGLPTHAPDGTLVASFVWQLLFA